MAIYHLSMQSVQWSKGHSAVAASAYRSGEKLYDERLDKTHDYTRKQRVEHSEIVKPDNSASWCSDRASLWNYIEANQRQKNARPAREIEIALPRELPLQDNIALAKDFINRSLVGRGLVVDFAIHTGKARDGGENPHAHIMFTTNRATPDGFEKTKLRDLDSKKTLYNFRREWEHVANKALLSHGFTEQIDHRSHKDRRIIEKPTKHLGKNAQALEDKGVKTDIGNENREAKQFNQCVTYSDSIETHATLSIPLEAEQELAQQDATASPAPTLQEKHNEPNTASNPPLWEKLLHNVIMTHIGSASHIIDDIKQIKTPFTGVPKHYKDCFSYLGISQRKNLPEPTHSDIKPDIEGKDNGMFEQALCYAKNTAVWLYEKPIEILHHIREQIHNSPERGIDR